MVKITVNEVKDFDSFMSILKNGNVYYTVKIEDNKMKIRIPNLEVGFIFDNESGKLIDFYNWKE